MRLQCVVSEFLRNRSSERQNGVFCLGEEYMKEKKYAEVSIDYRQ
jgi:hypothetical protein